MKKLTLTLALLIVLTGSIAHASNSVDLTINGEMPKACEISSYGDFRLQDLDLTSTAQTDAASITLACNYQGTATLTLSSANGGYLASGANQIPYTASLSGSSITDVSLASPVSWGGFPTVVGDQTRGFSIKLAPPAVVPAGFYQDVVTASFVTN